MYSYPQANPAQMRLPVGQPKSPASDLRDAYRAALHGCGVGACLPGTVGLSRRLAAPPHSRDVCRASGVETAMAVTGAFLFKTRQGFFPDAPARDRKRP